MAREVLQDGKLPVDEGSKIRGAIPASVATTKGKLLCGRLIVLAFAGKEFLLWQMMHIKEGQDARARSNW